MTSGPELVVISLAIHLGNRARVPFFRFVGLVFHLVCLTTWLSSELLVSWLCWYIFNTESCSYTAPSGAPARRNDVMNSAAAVSFSLLSPWCCGCFIDSSGSVCCSFDVGSLC